MLDPLSLCRTVDSSLVNSRRKAWLLVGYFFPIPTCLETGEQRDREEGRVGMQLGATRNAVSPPFNTETLQRYASTHRGAWIVQFVLFVLSFFLAHHI